MSRCRFLVDECLPSSLVRGLHRRLPGVSVFQVGNAPAPPKGSSDADLLLFCEYERRILISADRATLPDFVRRHLEAGRHTNGVLLIGPNVSLGLILEELSLVYEASEDVDWDDVLYYLPF